MGRWLRVGGQVGGYMINNKEGVVCSSEKAWILLRAGGREGGREGGEEWRTDTHRKIQRQRKKKVDINTVLFSEVRTTSLQGTIDTVTFIQRFHCM